MIVYSAGDPQVFHCLSIPLVIVLRFPSSFGLQPSLRRTKGFVHCTAVQRLAMILIRCHARPTAAVGGAG